MAGITLGRLLVAPGVIATPGDEPLSCLEPERTQLPGDHPLVAAAGRTARSGIPPWQVPLTSHVDFVNLGRDHPEPGLVVCLASGRGDAGAKRSAAWVAWGLPRPSVNLFLAPALVRYSSGMGDRPTHESLLELTNSKAFLDNHIDIEVRVEHVMEPLTYRIYPDTPAGEVQHLMLRRGLGVLPVVGKDHELLGVITADDVLCHILPRREGGPPSGRRNLSASDLMTRSVLCVSESETLAAASRSLISRGVARLPVVTAGRLVGFLSGDTVMQAFAEAFVTSRSPRRVDSGPTP